MGGLQLRAAIELVSPANKDRVSHRRAFAGMTRGHHNWQWIDEMDS
jgi:hypothetical protein